MVEELKANIQELLSERRYDPAIAPDLENYVEEQVKQEFYDLDANLALLRFYQYSPATAKLAVISKILVKALMELPGTDFMLCMYLIPVTAQKDPSIETLKGLADKLESCMFKQFWSEAANAKALTDSIPKFEDSIRNYIVGIVSATYQLIAREELEGYLNLSGAGLDAVLASKKWTAEGSDVRIPLNEYNEASVKLKQEGISFDQLAPIIVGTAV